MERGVPALAILQPPRHPVDQLGANLRAYRPIRKDLFPAVEVRRFRQNGGAPVAHQDIHRDPQGWVGGNTAEFISAAGLKADLEVFSPIRSSASRHWPRAAFRRRSAWFHRPPCGCRRCPGSSRSGAWRLFPASCSRKDFRLLRSQPRAMTTAAAVLGW